ncbi:MAG: pitrilysin family protein [Rhodothermales bacterium]
MTEHSNLDTFEERVLERRVGPCRLIMLPTPVQSVVTWRGSFMSYPDLDADEDLLQNVVVSLLDKGTRRRDRFAIAELLENKGAQVQFSSDGLYVDVSGRALREDVPDVLGLVAEQLREPLFGETEVEKAKARIGASLRRSMEKTGSQASGALTRQIYSISHPNYTPDPAERLARLESIGPEDVVQYHQRHFGGNAFTLAVVGDLDPDEIVESVRKHFSGWKEHDAPPAFSASAGPCRDGRTVVSMPGKQNVDVRMGHPVSFRRDDPEYIPVYLANYVLGGNFSARLMQTIRDEMGLTYGIRSGLYGITAQYEGHWQVAVTLSLENVERGIEETLREVRTFVDEGPSAEELADKKTTVIGSFKVGLATTSGLASSLLKNAERGFDVGYLDRFPDEVNGVTLAEAKAVIAKHFNPEAFHVAVAGGISDATR